MCLVTRGIFVPALGDFFDGFRDLALDASSRVRRDQLLSSASTVQLVLGNWPIDYLLSTLRL